MTTKSIADSLIPALSSVIHGKNALLELFVASYLSGGHVLIEDVPGLGKTTLAKTLSRLIGSIGESERSCSVFKRIQFTPDLLPYDITGVDVFNPQEHRFEFFPGPVFCDILLADEINRTTPKVQSALLEVMAERQITSGGKTRPVGDLFFVVATQNPVETEGTYPLPVAQLDRFMMRLSLGYPDEDAEEEILAENPADSILPTLIPIVDHNAILRSRAEQERVFCHTELQRALIHIVRETRSHPSFSLGVSPRGALQLLHAAKTLALMRGRDWVEDEDVADLAVPVLSHRIVPRDRRSDVSSIISAITAETLRKLDKKLAKMKDSPSNASE